MEHIRTSQEIENQLATLINEGDTLQAKAKANELTEDDSKRYDACLSEIEQLQAEHANAQRAERLAASKVAVSEPRPAPKFATAKVSRGNDRNDYAKALTSWMGGVGRLDNPEDYVRTGKYGFNLGATSVRLPCRWDFNRSISVALDKGTATTGAELAYETFSDAVTRYMALHSPFVSRLKTDVTDNGEPRTYYIMDGTSLKSTYMTASGGSEKNPTIPEKSVTTANKTINVFDITSGYHIVTWQRLRDAPFAVVAEDVVPNIMFSHTRLIEDEVINGTGNGANSISGLLDISDDAGDSPSPVEAWTIDVFESAYYSVPTQYRSGLMWLANGNTKGAIRSALKDGIDRSYFEGTGTSTTATASIEYDVLFEKPFFESDWMPDNKVLLFNSSFYILRLVSGQNLNVYRELFAPHVGYSSNMSFGGGWVGPAKTCITLELEASS